MAQSSRGKQNKGKGMESRPASPRSHKTKAALERDRQEREQRMLEFRRKCRITSVVLFAFSMLLFILMLFSGISTVASELIYGLLGLSAYVWVAIGVSVSVVLAIENPEKKIKSRVVLFLIAGGIISTLIHLLSSVCTEVEGFSVVDTMRTMFDRGIHARGAGALGGMFGALLAGVLGRGLSILLLVLGTFVFIMIISGSDIVNLFQKVSKPVKNVSARAVESAGRAAEQRRIEREERRIEREERRARAAFVDVPVDDYEEADDEDQEYVPPEQEERTVKRSRRKKIVEDIPETPDESDTYEDDEELTPLEEIRRASEKSSRRSSKAKEKPAAKEEPKQENEIDEDEFERLLMRFAGGQENKKQRQEELAKEVIAFAQEIKQQESKTDNYVFPDTGLLIAPENDNEGDVRDELRRNGEQLVETLREYGVEASVVGISRGPAVTRYELKPAPGVKISRITNLNKDIALRLAAKGVRIEAPIPGKAAVGVEIPNQNLSIVRIRTLLESEEFHDAKSPITVALGKDIDGTIVLADLAKMPHLLIAGATGMGKSVCINSMLMSLIFKSSPEDVRLIMVDPKSVELDVYNGLPHLLVPVVCDPKKAAGALQWAVTEMEKRYSLLREQGVRNIDGYNKIAERSDEIQKMPRIVIIIDEMADLMITAPKEVENTISRLAAMARAAGMHMVLATQRPSVDIITGTIKANVPSRIAFAVSSGVDSKIILDEGGAEELIGKGDMLLHPVGMAKPKRVQGCFVDDVEVERVVSFIKEHCSSDYDESIAREIERNASGGEEHKAESDDEFGNNDELFVKAIDVVTEAGQASVSLLQRRLGVGYARAGRLVDQLEANGIVGPYEGSKPRKVLMSRGQYFEMVAMRENPVQLRIDQVEQEPDELRPERYEPQDGYGTSGLDGLTEVVNQPEDGEDEEYSTVQPYRPAAGSLESMLDSLPEITIEEDDGDDDDDAPF